MANESIIIRPPDITGIECKDCTEKNFKEGSFECREYTKEDGNMFMQKSIMGMDLYQSGLVGEVVEEGAGKQYIETLNTGRFHVMGRNNGGHQNGRYSCFFRPQKIQQGNHKWSKIVSPEHLYIHLEDCPANMLDNIALPQGTTRKEVLSNASLFTDLVTNQMSKDWTEQVNYAATFGVSGHGLNGLNSGGKPQGSVVEGSGLLNGWVTQLYLAWKNNTYVYTEKVTFDATEWAVGKCLWVRIGNQVRKFSYSDYGTLALLLEALCDTFNAIRKEPNLIKRLYQATFDSMGGILYLASLDPQDIVLVTFVINDCEAPNWECKGQTGFTIESMQKSMEVNFAPTAYPFEAVDSANGIEYLVDFISNYYINALEQDRALANNVVVLIDPLIVHRLGLQLHKMNMTINGDPAASFIGNAQQIINSLALPIKTVAHPTFTGTGAIIIAPLGGLRVVTDEENSIQGYIETGVADAKCGTMYAKMEGFFNLYVIDPGKWYGNFCGLPYFNYLDTLDIRMDEIVKRNCVCPQNFRTDCIEAYNPNCDTLYRQVTEGQSITIQYISGTNDAITVSYILPLPIDIDEFEWSISDTEGGATAITTGGATNAFNFSGSVEGFEFLISMKIKTTSCPDGVLKKAVVRVENGQLTPINSYNNY